MNILGNNNICCEFQLIQFKKLIEEQNQYFSLILSYKFGTILNLSICEFHTLAIGVK